MSTDYVDAKEFLEKLLGGPISLGEWINAIRLGEEESLTIFAKKLGISRMHLCDIEKGRRVVSVERAHRWAKKLGYSPVMFVKLALEHQLQKAALKFTVDIKAA